MGGKRGSLSEQVNGLEERKDSREGFGVKCRAGQKGRKEEACIDRSAWIRSMS